MGYCDRMGFILCIARCACSRSHFSRVLCALYSCGVKQRYGATPQLHRGNFGQWLMTGRGLLHEEMWDVDSGQDQELYQIWIDLPRDR